MDSLLTSLAQEPESAHTWVHTGRNRREGGGFVAANGRPEKQGMVAKPKVIAALQLGAGTAGAKHVVLVTCKS